MADLKRRSLQLSSGKQIKLFGTGIAIGKTLELAEGYAPNILSLIEEQGDSKTPPVLSNPQKLTLDELNDIADFNIQLWMNLKAGLRKYGQVDPRIFGQDSTKTPTAEIDKSEPGRRRKSAADEA